MTLDKIIALIFSLSGIIFTYWFFLGKKDEVVDVKDNADIIVKGGFNPSTIAVRKGETTTLNFTRRDSNPCLEEVVLSDFKIKKYLPMNKKVSIPITPEKAGKYDITCGMNMFHGKIIVS